jgi:hypothetical protein
VHFVYYQAFANKVAFNWCPVARTIFSIPTFAAEENKQCKLQGRAPGGLAGAGVHLHERRAGGKA